MTVILIYRILIIEFDPLRKCKGNEGIFRSRYGIEGLCRKDIGMEKGEGREVLPLSRQMTVG